MMNNGRLQSCVRPFSAVSHDRWPARLMAKRNQLTRPMMRRCAGFEADKAWRNLGKECEDLAASQPLAHHDAACLVDRMNLEDTFCQIKTIRCHANSSQRLIWINGTVPHA